jgi:hypothetical protein
VSARQGWIFDPQPPKEWHDSHYSRQADKIRREDEKRRRAEEAKNLKPSEK